MKKFATIAIIMTLQLLVSAEPTTERDQSRREKIYENMAARLFSDYVQIRHSDLPKKEQQKWIHLGANAAFQYWMTTRKGGVRTSNQVDSAIAYFYENALESKMTAGFSDPLFRLVAEGTDNIGVDGFPEITKTQYKEYVEEFQEYLKGVLKVRQTRQDEARKRVESIENEAQQAVPPNGP